MELEIGPQLVGQQVSNPARPEWGVGTVLRVQSTVVAGETRHRVSVQFAGGHHVLQVPPARLNPPLPEPERQAGWLDALAGTTLDDRLWRLPAALKSELHTPLELLSKLARLYEFGEDPKDLSRWARQLTGVGDPLSQWSRDELLVAFGKFCAERDAELRVTVARLRHSGADAALDRFFAELSPAVAAAVRAALARPL